MKEIKLFVLDSEGTVFVPGISISSITETSIIIQGKKVECSRIDLLSSTVQLESAYRTITDSVLVGRRDGEKPAEYVISRPVLLVSSPEKLLKPYHGIELSTMSVYVEKSYLVNEDAFSDSVENIWDAFIV